jgi:hypothetical protein
MTEHVANQDNAFRVIHDLTRRDGIMFHEVPAHGVMAHGLISYDQKFFWHLCRENEYAVIKLDMRRCGTAPIPSNVINSNASFGGSVISPEAIPIFRIYAIRKKLHDRPFRTPLDLGSPPKRDA